MKFQATALLSALAVAGARKQALFPLQDSTIFGGEENTAKGIGTNVVGLTENGVRRSLVQFDLSEVPLGVNVKNVILSLDIEQNKGEQEVKLFRVTSPWSAGTAEGENVNGEIATNEDTTWKYSTFSSIPWKQAGGDFDPDVLSIEENSQFDSTEKLEEVIQGMIQGDIPNYGFMLIGSEEGEVAFQTFDSMEGAVRKQPKLVIEFDEEATVGDATKISRKRLRKRMLQDSGDGSGGEEGDADGGDGGGGGEDGGDGGGEDGGDGGGDEGDGGGDGGDGGVECPESESSSGDAGDGGDSGDGGDGGSMMSGGSGDNEGGAGDADGGDGGGGGDGGRRLQGGDNEGGAGDADGGDGGGGAEDGGDEGDGGDGGDESSSSSEDDPCEDDGGSGGLPGLGLCFSGQNVVEVMDQGFVNMDSLKIGDSVRVQGGKFSTVYSFGHYEKNKQSEFLQIQSTGLKTAIELSKDHMVFIRDGFATKSVPASSIKIGDALATENGISKVSKIKIVQSNGAYAPFTSSGDIVVSGVVASNYISMIPEKEIGVPVTMQWIAHTFNAPHRFVCQINFNICENETYTDGLSNWIYGPFYAGKWLSQQNTIVQMAGSGLLVAIMVLFPIALAASLVGMTVSKISKAKSI